MPARLVGPGLESERLLQLVDGIGVPAPARQALRERAAHFHVARLQAQRLLRGVASAVRPGSVPRLVVAGEAGASEGGVGAREARVGGEGTLRAVPPPPTRCRAGPACRGGRARTCSPPKRRGSRSRAPRRGRASLRASGAAPRARPPRPRVTAARRSAGRRRRTSRPTPPSATRSARGSGSPVAGSPSAGERRRRGSSPAGHARPTRGRPSSRRREPSSCAAGPRGRPPGRARPPRPGRCRPPSPRRARRP